MHELSLAQSVWREVRRQMRRRPDRRLVSVSLVVGRFSGADPESLQFAMGLLVADSDWPEADVRVRTEPLGLQCRLCRRRYTTDEMNLACPACGSFDAEVTEGRDLTLESLEVE